MPTQAHIKELPATELQGTGQHPWQCKTWLSLQGLHGTARSSVAVQDAGAGQAQGHSTSRSMAPAHLTSMTKCAAARHFLFYASRARPKCGCGGTACVCGAEGRRRLRQGDKVPVVREMQP